MCSNPRSGAIVTDFLQSTSVGREQLYVLPRADHVSIQQLCGQIQSELRPDLRVLLHDSDLEAEGVLEYNEINAEWLARPDWSTQRDLI
jgi:hypothetical protein